MSARAIRDRNPCPLPKADFICTSMMYRIICCPFFFFFFYASQMHESKHITVPVYSDGGDSQARDNNAAETQQLTEEGVPESKGEREYPV